MITLSDRIESSACPSACGQFIFVGELTFFPGVIIEKQKCDKFSILGCYDWSLYCINSVSGEIKWSFKTKGEVKCPPALCNGGSSVLFGSYDKLVYCVSAEVFKLFTFIFLFEII